jgi:hypothetical protein
LIKLLLVEVTGSRRLPPQTVATLCVWLTERAGQPDDQLFPARTRHPFSRDAFEHRLVKHAATAIDPRNSNCLVN